mmetsp:Transcript_1789/g.3175  ORF Transcript_1789/g.3175 Transcript_1789/m.3175 type:complete len:519 (-) Transcript_1789:177-1733(-)
MKYTTLSLGVLALTANFRSSSISMAAAFSLQIAGRRNVGGISHSNAQHGLYDANEYFSKRFSAVSSLNSLAISADTDVILPEFSTKEEYMEYLTERSALPQGFASGTASGKFISVEAPAMGPLPIRGTVIHLTDGPTDSWAAVFTKNKFPGSPIIVGRDRLAKGGPLHALVINNKVSNVCSGGDGVADSEKVCAAVADVLKLPGGAETVLPSSTGVIGWRLPATELAQDVVPLAVKALQVENAVNAAQAICTTDRYPKVRSKTLSCGARIVGIAKGAGMIEPNMATMLAYIMTDATVDKATLQSMLSESVNKSFNSISVDGSESTSDTVVALSSNLVPMSKSDGDIAEFKDALMEVCSGLSADIVRNGEGTGHVLRVKVKGYPGTNYQATQMGRNVVNSALFKCAVAGNDPNTGRLASAIGSFLGRFNEDASIDEMSITMGERMIFSAGKFILEGDEVEKELSKHMEDAQLGECDDFPIHQKFVEIGIDFGSVGTGTATVLGSDLTKEYVAVNADYRS